MNRYSEYATYPDAREIAEMNAEVIREREASIREHNAWREANPMLAALEDARAAERQAALDAWEPEPEITF